MWFVKNCEDIEEDVKTFVKVWQTILSQERGSNSLDIYEWFKEKV